MYINKQQVLPSFEDLEDAARFEKFVGFNERLLTPILLCPRKHIERRLRRLEKGLETYGDFTPVSDRAQALIATFTEELRDRNDTH